MKRLRIAHEVNGGLTAESPESRGHKQVGKVFSVLAVYTLATVLAFNRELTPQTTNGC